MSPRLLSGLNRLLRKKTGRLIIVDMERLPIAEAESKAINWTGAEIETVLTQGGFSPEVTVHEKSTRVFQAHVARSDAVHRSAMLAVLRRLIEAKIELAAEERERLAASSRRTRDGDMNWVTLTGSLARYGTELLAIDAVMRDVADEHLPSTAQPIRSGRLDHGPPHEYPSDPLARPYRIVP